MASQLVETLSNINTEKEKYLKKLCFDIKSPDAYSGAQNLYRVVKEKGDHDISRQEIKKWLQTQPIYTSNRRVVRKFDRRKFISPYMHYMYDSDVAYMNDYAKDNGGYKYFLVFVDTFSRFVWSRKIKKLDAKHIRASIKSIFRESKKTPEHFRSDKGWEMKRKAVDSFLTSKGVNHIVIASSKFR